MKTTNIYLNTVKVFMFQFSPYNFTAVSSNTLADTAFPVAIFRKEFAFCQCHFLCSTSSESLFASLFSVSTQVSKFNFIFFTSLIPSSISLRFTFFSFSITLSLFPYKGIVYLWCTSLQLLIKFEVLEFYVFRLNMIIYHTLIFERLLLTIFKQDLLINIRIPLNLVLFMWESTNKLTNKPKSFKIFISGKKLGQKRISMAIILKPFFWNFFI